MIRCLTLWRPWPYAIAKLGKRVENRTWPLPAWMLGEHIAIHAGKRMDREALEDLAYDLGEEFPDETIDDPENHPDSTIVAVGLAVGCIRARSITTDPANPAYVPPAVIMGDVDLASISAYWFHGPYGWILDQVRAIEPIRNVRGAQGLWKPNAKLVFEMHQRWKAAA